MKIFIENMKGEVLRRCSKCGQYKLLSEYYKSKNESHGVFCQCKKCAYEAKYKNRIDRFWKYYHSRIVKNNECLEWAGAYNSTGLPTCRWDGQQKNLRRVVYELANGDPGDLLVTTNCKNSRCVRQSHLVAVTKEQFYIRLSNNQPTGDDHWTHLKPDKLACGDRHWTKQHPESIKRGESVHNAKLNAELVRKLRADHSNGMAKRAIARLYGIPRTTLQHVLDGTNWGHVE
jgi:uncharacterized C2H2 Zn-finger protein